MIADVFDLKNVQSSLPNGALKIGSILVLVERAVDSCFEGNHFNFLLDAYSFD
jgi:hypothetical protein